MEKNAKYVANGLRFLLGWFMLWDGISLLTNPNFTSASFLNNAKTFPEFFAWFAQSSNLWWVDPLNVWGIILIGAALILGIGTRLACFAGVILMLLYYFAHHAFPVVPHGYIVEEHIIYAGLFIFIALSPAARSLSFSRLMPKVLK